MEKKCILCGSLYKKKPSCSLKKWENSKYCSRRCCDFDKVGKEISWLKDVNKGRNPWNKGIKGRHFSPATEFKKGEERLMGNNYARGHTPWNKGKKHRPETIEKLRKARANQIMPPEAYKKAAETKRGRIYVLSDEQREKMRLARLGDKCHFWKGGITEKNKLLRVCWEYKSWRTNIYERDNYTCVTCGKWGGKLNAHHIKPFADFPNLRYVLNNGITLCRECHIRVHTKK